MCLSDVYLVKPNHEKELICRKIASVKKEDKNVVLTDILGVTTVVEAEVDSVDLMENYVYLRGESR